MFDSDDNSLSANPTSENKGSEARLIAELERQSIEQIRQVRAHKRISSHVGVELRPGNASARGELPLSGKTNDISEGGCSAIFPSAILPGDIFQLQFDAKAIDVPVVFAHAMRCRMLKEGSFETGFRFFSPVVIKPRMHGSDELFT
ncbi:MAG: c-di-GMP-binding flagellar brake protein YcgR [Gammaproteobacteria bacterium]|jgi:c-di-GMP-binding flagellar brake protein YcgR